MASESDESETPLAFCRQSWQSMQQGTSTLLPLLLPLMVPEIQHPAWRIRQPFFIYSQA
jgi:hypothetical protein